MLQLYGMAEDDVDFGYCSTQYKMRSR
ncbi:MAG TPA: hypothetical protein ENH62_00460 [Marinobacter sp.]|uniref:Uncharacterized protein n=1 Tax=Marinobacter antarcticus TaxID=564117 RepID=A0A831VVV5_9GAMM|nr:hypothetical protein [Marinobacter sp.]HEA53338.1 hypothetical protein [Marinobacter antarcticus]